MYDNSLQIRSNNLQTVCLAISVNVCFQPAISKIKNYLLFSTLKFSTVAVPVGERYYFPNQLIGWTPEYLTESLPTTEDIK